MMMELGQEFFNLTQSAMSPEGRPRLRHIAKRLGVTQKNISEILAKLDTGKGNWKDRLKTLYRSLYRKLIGTAINQDAIKNQMVNLKEIRDWLAMPDLLGKVCQETIENLITELVRLLKAGEDITQYKDIKGFHPIALVTLALKLAPE